MLALLAGGIIAQLPLAAADNSDSPFSALWDAIFDLKSRDDQLQAQIDELRVERQSLSVQSSGGEPLALVSDLYATIEVQTLEQGRTIVHITAGNNGPDRAAGVRLTAFYLMPLFEINSIDGDLCMDKSRGIVECIIGTLEQGQKVVIAVDATARESGRANTWTVDVSTTTDDADYSNNHVTYDFETGSGKQMEEVIEIQQLPERHEVVEEEPEATAEPEEEDDDKGGMVPNNSSTEVEDPENAENQTSTDPEEETPDENQTSTETQDLGSNNSSTNTDNEEQEDSGSKVVDDSSSNNTNEVEDETEQSEEGSNNGSEETQEENQAESESSQPTTTEQTQEQSAPEESGSEPAADPSSDESPANESSDNSQQESSESGSTSEGDSNSSQGHHSDQTESI